MCNTQDKNKESAAKLREFVTQEKNSDWSKTLYESYFELFRHDNSQIWITGAILIPLSLAGLTAYKESDSSQVILMASGSIVMIWFWYFMQRKFRAFQNGNLKVIEEIEKALGLDVIKKLRESTRMPCVKEERLELCVKANCLIRWCRIKIKCLNLLITAAITVIWIAATWMQVVTHNK